HELVRRQREGRDRRRLGEGHGVDDAAAARRADQSHQGPGADDERPRRHGRDARPGDRAARRNARPAHADAARASPGPEEEEEMKKTPLTRVNDEFGGKGKLVDAIVDAVERGDEDKASLKKRLLAASNTKLMRLLQTAKQVKEVGGKAKLLDAVAERHGKAKDKDYRTRLEGYTIGRLLDMYRVAS